MFATMIIILREVIEICLFLGMFSAALREVRDKNKIILLGILGGIIISILLAFGMNRLSNLFDGTGQEIINIVTLFIAILCILWTLIWVRKHDKKFHERIINLENQNIIPIALLIMLSIAREGSEIILFSYGILARGTSNYDLVYGIILGTTLGMGFGITLYFGLLRIPTKYFFRTINFLLILLAAGMASQIAENLIAADLVTVFSNSLWDSGWLISEKSLFGKLLHDLAGYSSQPTGLQFVFYVTTFMALYTIHKRKI
ncbi:MAG: FTR1 family protein [Pseudomonadota bacterium]